MKTTETVVSVTVEDVNDNAPGFDEPSYSVTLVENSPVDAVLFKAPVTDLDQVVYSYNTHMISRYILSVDAVNNI